jgi:hypothetical protein
LNDNSPIDEFCRFTAPPSHHAALEALQRRIKKRPLPEVPNPYTASGLTADNTYLYIKAKLLKSILKCKEDLSFGHFPMNKILKDAAEIRTEKRPFKKF